jgi:peptidoglycan/LPS O-acetylase OafA/YrhL
MLIHRDGAHRRHAIGALAVASAGGRTRDILRYGLPVLFCCSASLSWSRTCGGWRGDSAYRTYLCHQIVQAVLARLLPAGWYDATLLVALPVGAGFVLYATVERPMTRRLMRWASRSRPAVAVQAA